MIELLKYIAVFILMLSTVYFLVKGIIAPWKNRENLIPTDKAIKSRAVYLSLAVLTGLLAIELFLPSVLWLILLPLSLLVIWVEYLIHMFTWH